MDTVRNVGETGRSGAGEDAAPVDAVASNDRRRLTLILLGAIFAAHLLDRQIFAILIPPIKAEFALSDTALGALSGLAFTIFFSTIGVAIARLADRADRARIITGSLALFSAMTAVCGLATGFWSLLLARIGVGVGEGGTNPASHSLIADLYPSGQRATAAAVYSVGPHLGIVIAFGLGGWVAQGMGWRVAFVAAGALGLVLAVVCAVGLRDPRAARPVRAGLATPRPTDIVRTLFGMPTFRHLVAGATLATAGALGVLTWLPALLTRVHGFTLAQAGLVLALGFGVLGAAGTFAVGRIADAAAKTDARRKAWVTGACQLLIAALWLPALLADDRAWVLVLAVVPCALAGAYLGPTIAMIQDVVDPRARAFSAAIAILVINLIGASAGPLVVGALSDLLMPRLGVQSLAYALLAVPVFLAWSAFHYARAAGGRL